MISFLALAGAVASALQVLGMQGRLAYAVPIAIVAVLPATHVLRYRSERTLKVPRVRTKVRVKVGDLWAIEGHKVVAVNEFFDGELGRRVEPTSLHGQAIQRLADGEKGRFEGMVDAVLAERKMVGQAVEGVDRSRFPIGTTAPVEYNGHLLLLTVLSRVNVDTFKASADVGDLWRCLVGTWAAVRDNANGRRVAVPLLGSGLSDVPMSTRELLHFCLLSIAYSSRFQRITGEIVVVLTPETFGEVDLAHCSFE